MRFKFTPTILMVGLGYVPGCWIVIQLPLVAILIELGAWNE